MSKKYKIRGFFCFCLFVCFFPLGSGTIHTELIIFLKILSNLGVNLCFLKSSFKGQMFSGKKRFFVLVLFFAEKCKLDLLRVHYLALRVLKKCLAQLLMAFIFKKPMRCKIVNNKTLSCWHYRVHSQGVKRCTAEGRNRHIFLRGKVIFPDFFPAWNAFSR